eukprot:scaffold183584_cov28-Tisochrysis_lutea.AAC.2
MATLVTDGPIIHAFDTPHTSSMIDASTTNAFASLSRTPMAADSSISSTTGPPSVSETSSSEAWAKSTSSAMPLSEPLGSNAEVAKAPTSLWMLSSRVKLKLITGRSAESSSSREVTPPAAAIRRFPAAMTASDASSWANSSTSSAAIAALALA